MTLDDLLGLYVIEHVIPTLFGDDGLARRERAFLKARDCMDKALSRGRPFVASDGFEALVIAMPGQPLMVHDHETGKLHVAKEQDFMALLKSVW